MNKKILIIIITVFGILLLGFSAYLIISNIDNSTNNTNTEKNDPNMGAGSNEYQVRDEDAVYTELYKIFEQLYPDNYEFNIKEDEVLTFTLNDLEKKGLDISFFNSDTCTCNKDTTSMQIVHMDGMVVRQANLDCSFNK